MENLDPETEKMKRARYTVSIVVCSTCIILNRNLYNIISETTITISRKRELSAHPPGFLLRSRLELAQVLLTGIFHTTLFPLNKNSMSSIDDLIEQCSWRYSEASEQWTHTLVHCREIAPFSAVDWLTTPPNINRF